MNKLLTRTKYPQALIDKGYTLKCDPSKFEYFLGTEKKEILGIGKRSTFDMLDEIPINGGNVRQQTKDVLVQKLCIKFSLSLDQFWLKHSKRNIRARTLYAKLLIRQGKTIKEVADILKMNLSSMYYAPFSLGKYQHAHKNVVKKWTLRKKRNGKTK